MSDGQNRRFNLRGDIDIPVVVLIGRDNPHAHACRTADLSAGGMKVVSTRRLPWHAEVVAAFKIPGYDDKIVVRCEVIRRRLHDDGLWRVGLRFLDLDPESRARIGRFVVRSLATTSSGEEPLEEAV